MVLQDDIDALSANEREELSRIFETGDRDFYRMDAGYASRVKLVMRGFLDGRPGKPLTPLGVAAAQQIAGT